MKTKILLTGLVMFILAACSKDKYQTKPQLTFKKVNTHLLQKNELLSFTLEVTDAEGDIQDSIWIQKVVPKCTASQFTSRQKMPDFTATKDLKASIDITYFYGRSADYPSITGPVCPVGNARPDTATFRFWIKDKAKNTSDTVVSDVIVITP